MLFCLLLTCYAGLRIDADSPCNLVQVRGVIQLGSQYFVLDKGEYQVKVTNDRGELLTHFGRQGEGPGEFQYPSAIGAVAGEIWVHDQIQSHVQRFTTEGKYLGVHNISAIGPLQFEPEFLILHTPTQASAFIVLDREFKEVGKVGEGMNAIGGIRVEEVVRFLQVFTTDAQGRHLYSLGVNGQTFSSYDLGTMTRQSARDLSLANYAAAQKVEDTGGGIRTSGGRPVKSVVFHEGHLYTLVVDENQEAKARMVILDPGGNIVGNSELGTYYTRIVANPGHGSAFFINEDESLIEERPLRIDSK